jgi:hypothetical protein
MGFCWKLNFQRIWGPSGFSLAVGFVFLFRDRNLLIDNTRKVVDRNFRVLCLEPLEVPNDLNFENREITVDPGYRQKAPQHAQKMK